MPKPVTDPDLLKQLNASDSSSSNGGKPVTDPKVLEQLNTGDKKAEPESWWGVAKDFGRGAAGLLQSVGEILPDPMRAMGIAPQLDERQQEARKQAEGELRKFTDVKPTSMSGKAAKLAGSIAPTMLLPGVGATSTLGSIVERAIIGAVAGGLQPTSEHTAASHIPGALGGAATGGLGRIAGQVAPRIGQIPAAHRAILGSVLQPPIEGALKTAGFNDKDARKYSLMVSGALITSGIIPLPASSAQSVLGGVAARLGSAAGGATAEEVSEHRQKPRSSEGQ